MSLLGYFINPGAAQCLGCFEDEGGLESWRQQGWEDPDPIDSLEEASAPEHCRTCGVLLPQTLGPEGLHTVADALADALQQGLQNPVTSGWVAEYGESLDEDAMLELTGRSIEQALVAYHAMPRDPEWLRRSDLRVHAELAGWL